jgi:hypothetical protein
VDEVIFCTGYQFDFSIIEQGRLIGVHDNDFQLYLHMFPTELRQHPTLACIGFVQLQLGSVWPIAELQARLFFAVQSGQVQLPTVFEMRADAEWRRCCMNLDFLRTRRHAHIEDFVAFSNELSTLLGIRPTLTTLLFDPKLAWHYFMGPLVSYQHQLNGWKGARKAIIEQPAPNPSLWLLAVVIFLFLAVLFKVFV